MPRKKLKPSEDQRRHVKSLAAVGIASRDIARFVGVSEKTLLKHYRDELFRGPLEANANVGKKLLEMASSGASAAATIFYVKARCGLHENSGREASPAALPDFVVSQDKKAA